MRSRSPSVPARLPRRDDSSTKARSGSQGTHTIRQGFRCESKADDTFELSVIPGITRPADHQIGVGKVCV